MANKNFDATGFYAVIILSQFVIFVITLLSTGYIIKIIGCIIICLSSVVMYLFAKEMKSSGQKHPVKPNNTHLNTPAHKENTNNNPVKQFFSPNISEFDKLTKQIESIKNDFKIINHEVDNSIFNQFNLLKKNLYLEYEKINWKENTNKEISEKYQTVIDSYVEAMNNEYLKIKQQFTDILNNEIKSKIDNVEKQFN